MQSARATWTDERMDDLATRVDRDIRDLRAEVKAGTEALRAEIKSGDEALREEMSTRFGDLERTIHRFGGGMLLTFAAALLAQLPGQF
jgi:hypothetical protein